MKVYRLKILTPEKKFFDEEAVSLLVHCENGQLMVLAGHAPLIAMLTEGPIIIQTESGTIEGYSGPGMLHVGRTETAVMLHTFQWLTEENENVTTNTTANATTNTTAKTTTKAV